MEGLTAHLATEGYAVPGSNAGSNPLAQGSEYHLGPALDIFTIKFTPEIGFVDFDQHFVNITNPYLRSTSNDALTVVMAASDDASPSDMRIRVGGVAYKVPYAIASTIRGPISQRVHWVASVGLGFVKDRGSFRFFRNAPGI